jgi:hypothetical protein
MKELSESQLKWSNRISLNQTQAIFEVNQVDTKNVKKIPLKLNQSFYKANLDMLKRQKQK